jgi:hypothetical protein
MVMVRVMVMDEGSAVVGARGDGDAVLRVLGPDA